MKKLCECGHTKGEHWFGFSRWAKKHNKKIGVDKRFKNMIKKDLCSCQTCYENSCRLRGNQCHNFVVVEYNEVEDKYGRKCLVRVKA